MALLVRSSKMCQLFVSSLCLTRATIGDGRSIFSPLSMAESPTNPGSVYHSRRPLVGRVREAFRYSMSGLWRYEDTAVLIDWSRRELFPSKVLYGVRRLGLSYQAQPARRPITEISPHCMENQAPLLMADYRPSIADSDWETRSVRDLWRKVQPRITAILFLVESLRLSMPWGMNRRVSTLLLDFSFLGLISCKPPFPR